MMLLESCRNRHRKIKKLLPSNFLADCVAEKRCNHNSHSNFPYSVQISSAMMDGEEWAWFEPFNHLATEMIQNMHSLCLGLSVRL